MAAAASPSRRRTRALVAALSIGVIAGCANASGASNSASSASTLPSPVTLPHPVTTPAPSTSSASTALATTTTVPATTSTDASTTTSSTTTVPPTTVAPPQPASPDPAPGLAAPIAPAGSGPALAAAQQRLLDLGFWLDGVNGQMTWPTSQALLAFQKYNGLNRTSKLDAATAQALNAAATKAQGAANLGDLVEVDLTRQVLFVIRGGKVVWAFNTSTGSGKPYSEKNQLDPTKTETGVAITPPGWFKVDRQKPDGWWEGDLGKIYRPKYFNGGIAVHGMTNVPAYPASHGCVRVSLPAMDFIWAQNLLPIGMRVWVH